MTIDGRPYAPRSPIEARRAGVAMIYQELSLAPHLTVMENILLGAEPMRFGLVDRARMRADGVGGARAARARRHPARRRRRHAVGRGAAARRDRARARGRLPRPRARRADEQPRRAPTSQHLFALLRRLQGAGARDRLHLALHRGGEGDHRSLRRAARRTQRRRRRRRAEADARRASSR